MSCGPSRSLSQLTAIAWHSGSGQQRNTQIVVVKKRHVQILHVLHFFSSSSSLFSRTTIGYWFAFFVEFHFKMDHLQKWTLQLINGAILDAIPSQKALFKIAGTNIALNNHKWVMPLKQNSFFCWTFKNGPFFDWSLIFECQLFMKAVILSVWRGRFYINK